MLQTEMFLQLGWLDEPEDHDFPAAQDYLELIFKPEIAASLANKL